MSLRCYGPAASLKKALSVCTRMGIGSGNVAALVAEGRDWKLKFGSGWSPPNRPEAWASQRSRGGSEGIGDPKR
jgi:hypothetical protein